MNAIVWLVAIALGALLNHMGGTSCGTKWRDIGVPVVFVAYMAYLGAISGVWQGISVLVSAAALGTALSTYRYFLPKPATGYRWYHYALHGFFTSFTAVFYIFYGSWQGIAIRCLVVAVGMGALTFIPWKKTQEPLRGALLIATVPWIV